MYNSNVSYNEDFSLEIKNKLLMQQLKHLTARIDEEAAKARMWQESAHYWESIATEQTEEV
jgi:hypothetical protein